MIAAPRARRGHEDEEDDHADEGDHGRDLDLLSRCAIRASKNGEDSIYDEVDTVTGADA